jgi:hypothetical protein
MNCCDGDCEQGRNCPHRGKLGMTEGNRQWALGVLVGVVLTSLIFIGWSKINPRQPSEPIANLIPKDIIEAYNTGLKDALRLNPVSLELDQACLTLWANKQPFKE